MHNAFLEATDLAPFSKTALHTTYLFFTMVYNSLQINSLTYKRNGWLRGNECNFTILTHQCLMNQYEAGGLAADQFFV